MTVQLYKYQEINVFGRDHCQTPMGIFPFSSGSFAPQLIYFIKWSVFSRCLSMLFYIKLYNFFLITFLLFIYLFIVCLFRCLFVYYFIYFYFALYHN